jgi:hypothetical protein
MNKPLKENEIRRLLSRAWGRRRRRPNLLDVRNARHLNLNLELDDEARGDRLKYFFAVLVVGAFLYMVYSRSGLG